MVTLAFDTAAGFERIERSLIEFQGKRRAFK